MTISKDNNTKALRAAGNAKAVLVDSGLPFYGQLCAAIYVVRSYAADAGGEMLHHDVRVLCDEIYGAIHFAAGDGGTVEISYPETQDVLASGDSQP